MREPDTRWDAIENEIEAEYEKSRIELIENLIGEYDDKYILTDNERWLLEDKLKNDTYYAGITNKPSYIPR